MLSPLKKFLQTSDAFPHGNPEILGDRPGSFQNRKKIFHGGKNGVRLVSPGKRPAFDMLQIQKRKPDNIVYFFFERVHLTPPFRKLSRKPGGVGE